MSCKELIEIASKLQKILDCPKKLSPKCHPRAHVEVFVDGKKGIITLVCSKCDKTISTPIRVKGIDGKYLK